MAQVGKNQWFHYCRDSTLRASARYCFARVPTELILQMEPCPSELTTNSPASTPLRDRKAGNLKSLCRCANVVQDLVLSKKPNTLKPLNHEAGDLFKTGSDMPLREQKSFVYTFLRTGSAVYWHDSEQEESEGGSDHMLRPPIWDETVICADRLAHLIPDCAFLPNAVARTTSRPFHGIGHPYIQTQAPCKGS